MDRNHQQVFPALIKIMLHTGLGGFGGWFLCWGPFGMPGWAALLVGIGFGLSCGWLVFREGNAEESQNQLISRSWPLTAGKLEFGLLLLIGVCALIQLNTAGVLPHPFESREKNFYRLARAIELQYPYLAEKDLDLELLVQSYLPQVESASSDAEYHRLVAGFLSEMEDAHTGLIQPRVGSDRHYFGTGKLLYDGIVVDQIGPTAQNAGITTGAQFLSVNGRSIEMALAAMPLPLRAGSTPWQSQYRAAFHLLSTASFEMEISYRNPGGQVETATLIWPGDPIDRAQGQNEDRDTLLITGEELPSGIVTISIPSFSRQTGHDLVQEFDQVLNNALDAPGVIIDLRGNSGGDSRIADRIVGRFLEEKFCYGQDRFTTRSPLHAWLLRWNYCVRPRGDRYTGQILLLIDTSNMSSTEQFIAALASSGRAITFGRRTAGASGNPVTYNLTGGGKARFSTAAFFLADGTLLEGSGISPDYPVKYTVQDYQYNRDPDLDAALSYFSRSVISDQWGIRSQFVFPQYPYQN